MRRSPSSSRSRALAAVLALSVGLGIAECAVRERHAHPPFAATGQELAPKDMYVASATMGFQLAPSFSYPEERFTTNRLGLRDRERSSGAAGGLRIAVAGGSSAAGVGVGDAQTAAALLEAALDGVEVWNLGTPHHGLEQSWRRLEAFWSVVEPDVVVLEVAPGTDPWRDAEGPGWLRVRDGRLVEAGWAPSGSPLDPLRQGIHRPLFAHHLPGDGPLWRRSYLYRAGLGALSRRRTRPMEPWPWGMEPFAWEVFGAVPWLHLSPAPPPVAAAWGVTAAALSRIQSLVEGHGARLLLVAAPSRVEVHDGDLRRALASGRSLGPRPGGGSRDRRRGFDPDLPQASLAALAADRGLPLLDVRASFRRAAWTERVHYRDGGQWTPGGQREAARSIGRLLEAQGLLTLPADFEPRLDAAVPVGSFEETFQGGFRPTLQAAPGDARIVGGRNAEGRLQDGGDPSGVGDLLCDPRQLVPLLPPPPRGWTRSRPRSDIAPLLAPQEAVWAAQAWAVYTDPTGRPHRVVALDSGGQPAVDAWLRRLGADAILPSTPPSVPPTAARVAVVVAASLGALAAGVDRAALTALEGSLPPSGAVHRRPAAPGDGGGGGPPRATEDRLSRPEALMPALAAAPPDWQVLRTVLLLRPHALPEFLALPPDVEARFAASAQLAGRDEEPWSSEAERWLRGPWGSFVLSVQDTGHHEQLLRSRHSRLLRAWEAGPASGGVAEPWEGAGLRGARTCDAARGTCTVVAALVDPSDPGAPFARYNVVVTGPAGAEAAAYAVLVRSIDRSALP